MSRMLTIGLLVTVLAGCGEHDLIDDSLPSDAQVRSLVEQFQQAAVEGDNQKACDLMDDQMRNNTRVGVSVPGAPPPLGEGVQLDCSAFGALIKPARELPSLPGAEIARITISKHDDTADVQLGNGTRFFLRRVGSNADGEWRINSMGYRPSAKDWPRGSAPASG